MGFKDDNYASPTHSGHNPYLQEALNKLSDMKNGDKPAFSSTGLIDHGEHPANCVGLTKREYFAAMAMQGLLSNQTALENILSISGTQTSSVTEVSVMMADKLLAELDKTKSE